MATTLDIQRALKAAGFDPGPLDGIKGRMTTAAVKRFQESKGLVADGIAGPKTIAVLFPAVPGEPLQSSPLPWMELAARKKGLHERNNYTAVSTFLKSDGKTLGDPRKLPWCGDFVETCIAVTLPEESLPGNPYLARNWLKFGVPCEPQLGAVLVFWRGAKNGISGHVAFDAGAGKGVLYCLGGNQSNSISVTSIATNRLLGARWPKTVPLPDKIIQPVMMGGVLSTNEA